MKVSTFNSVGAKLFYYMSSLVLITVVISSVQYAKTFSAFMAQQVQDTVQQQAESAASQFENTVETWRTLVAVTLPTLRAAGEGQGQGAPAPGALTAHGKDKAPEVDSGLRRFVDANPEFIAFELLGAAGPTATKFTPLGEILTSNVSDKNFEDKEPAKVWGKLKGVANAWLRKQAGKMTRKSNVAVESVAKATGLPIMLMAVRFEVAGSSQVVWAVLAAWQDGLIKTLPKSRFTSSFVVDGKGQVVTSPNLADMMNRKTVAGPLLRSALSGASPSGFESEYKDTDGRRKLGAFTRLPRYDLAVLVETDAEFAYATLRRNVTATALWAALFILVAVMFSFFGAAGITKGLRAVTYATGRIAAGDLQYQIPAGAQDEVGALGAAVNNMSRKIVDLMQVQVDKARFEKELETAKIVQSTFFPKQDIRGRDVVVTGFYQPASECGGDLWGHYPIADGLEFLFIADAMGHGAPAALVTAIAYSTTMTIADIIKSDPTYRDSPARILGRLNRVIYDAVRGSISMTFFGALIDTNRGEITYSNAGHNFPVIVPLHPDDPRAGKATKQSARHGGIQPISLKQRGTPLGMDPATEYHEDTMALKAGDKLFFFTDGLIECSSPTGAVWGRKHLLERVAEAGRMSAEEMKDEILAQAFGFFGAKPLDDDVTVVVAELRRDWAARPLSDAGPHPAKPLVAVIAEAFAVAPAPAAARLSAAAPSILAAAPSLLADAVSMPPAGLAAFSFQDSSAPSLDLEGGLLGLDDDLLTDEPASTQPLETFQPRWMTQPTAGPVTPQPSAGPVTPQPSAGPVTPRPTNEPMAPQSTAPLSPASSPGPALTQSPARPSSSGAPPPPPTPRQRAAPVPQASELTRAPPTAGLPREAAAQLLVETPQPNAAAVSPSPAQSRAPAGPRGTGAAVPEPSAPAPAQTVGGAAAASKAPGAPPAAAQPARAPEAASGAPASSALTADGATKPTIAKGGRYKLKLPTAG